MTATSSRSHTPVEAPPGPAAPATFRTYLASSPEGRVAWAAVVLVAVFLVVRGWAVSRGWLYSDDLAWQGLAARHDRPDRELLGTPWNGHAMPAGWVVAWLFTHVAPLEMWPVALSSVALLAAYAWLLFLVLRRLFGSRPEVLLLLALGLFPALTLPVTLWWAVQLAQLPLLVAGAAAVWAHLGYLRHRRWRDVGLVALAVAVGLLFSERTLLVLPLLALLTVGWFSGQTAIGAATWSALRSHVRLWAVLALLALAFLAWYVVSVPSPASPGGDPALFVDVLWESVQWALVPALLGGPWSWLPLDEATSVAQPSAAVRLLCLTAFASVVVASCLARRHAARGWALLAVYVAIGALMLTGTRAAVIGAISGREFRYFTELALVVPLSVGLATLPVRWPVAGTGPLRLVPRPLPAGVAEAAAPWRPVAAALRARPWPWVAAACALLVVSSTVTVVAHDRNWHSSPARDFVETARAELADQPDVRLADGPVPAEVLSPLAAPHHLASRVLAPVTQPGRFLTSGAAGDELRVLDGRGRLRPVVVAGPAAAGGPVPGCGWLVRQDAVTVPLPAPTAEGRHLVRLGYYTDAQAVTTVTAGGSSAAALLRPGLHVLFVVADGVVDGVVVDGLPAGAVCVTDVAVGAPGPQP